MASYDGLRVRYSLAYGRANNFYTGISGQKGYLAGTDGLFAQANTSPDVSLGTLFYTNNSAATTITSFQLQHPSVGAGNFAGLYEGKEIKIFFLDSNTTLSGASLNLQGNQNTFPANSFLTLLYHNSAWYEQGRSFVVNQALGLSIAGSASFNANGVDTILLSGTGATNVLVSISNGIASQKLYVVNNSTSTISISTAGNIVYSFTPATYFPGSGGGLIVVLAASGVAQFVKVGGGAGPWALVGR